MKRDESKAEEPDFKDYGISEETFLKFSGYTSIRPTAANGPIFLCLLILSFVTTFCLATFSFRMSLGGGVLVALLFSFPLAFLLQIFFAYCAQGYFLNFNLEKEPLRNYVKARRHCCKRAKKG